MFADPIRLTVVLLRRVFPSARESSQSTDSALDPRWGTVRLRTNCEQEEIRGLTVLAHPTTE